MKNANRGFTLIELVLTLGLIGIIMGTIYVTLYGTLREKQWVEIHVMGSRVGPLLLDQIERDVRQLYAFNLAHGAVFRGEDERIGGQDADKFLFVAQVPSTSAQVDDDYEGKAVFAAVNEIGYALAQNPDNPDFMVLFRREDFFVDEEPLKGGRGTQLYDRITGFNVVYYDRLGPDAEKEDDWDSEKKEGMPAALEITLTLEVEPRNTGSLTAQELERRTYSFKRWITFPTDIAQTMAIRPRLPALAALDGGGPAAGADKDGDGVPDSQQGEEDDDDDAGGSSGDGGLPGGGEGGAGGSGGGGGAGGLGNIFKGGGGK